MIKLLENKLNVEYLDSDTLIFNCILHQESLCKVALDLKHVVNPVKEVVNTIKTRAFYHGQYKSLLEDVEAEYVDVIQCSVVEPEKI